MQRCRHRDQISSDTELYAWIGVGDRETDHICDTENVNSIYTSRIVHHVLINNLSLIFNGNTIPIKRSGNRIGARNVAVYLKRHHDLLL